MCNNYLLSKTNSQKHSMGKYRVTEKFLFSCGKQILDRVVVAVDEQVRGAFVLEVDAVAYPGILFGGGGSTNSVEDRRHRERGSGDSSPLVRGSGGSCNLVQEMSFHIVTCY
jgi:hypothetical protein